MKTLRFVPEDVKPNKVGKWLNFNGSLVWWEEGREFRVYLKGLRVSESGHIFLPYSQSKGFTYDVVKVNEELAKVIVEGVLGADWAKGVGVDGEVGDYLETLVLGDLVKANDAFPRLLRELRNAPEVVPATPPTPPARSTGGFFPESVTVVGAGPLFAREDFPAAAKRTVLQDEEVFPPFEESDFYKQMLADEQREDRRKARDAE